MATNRMPRPLRSALCLFAGLALAASLGGCKRLRKADTQPLYQAGMFPETIQKLQELKVTDAEIAELTRAREAGISDTGCVELLRIARVHKQPFASGDAAAGLYRVGVGEPAILELAQLNQLGLWSGEAQAMHLAGLSDRILLTVARRRAQGKPTASGASLAELRNVQVGEAQMLRLIENGLTDEQAGQMVAARRRAGLPHGFVRERGRRRRR